MKYSVSHKTTYHYSATVHQSYHLLHLSPRVVAHQSVLRHRLIVAPEPGMLVMFPSWLEHWVTPYRGKGQRISVAFNAVGNAPA